MNSVSVPELNLRPPEQVMTLARIGSFHPTRISFVRSLIRRIARENWRVERPVFDLSDEGYGAVVYRVVTPAGPVSLVCFSNALDEADRTDRVIAERWDTAFVLIVGDADAATIERLRLNAPLQEAGRFQPGDIVLSRANKSMRLFSHFTDRLSAGQQPDLDQALNVGYLMRTTAVYGNGKLGMSDLAHVFSGGIFHRPYEAEMLAVYLIRLFSFDLIDHIARRQNPDTAVPLDDEIKRALGVGNATGLGMAPFLLGHPTLFNNWIMARETALARVRAVETADAATCDRFRVLLARVLRYAEQWHTDDKPQMAEIETLRRELRALLGRMNGDESPIAGDLPWDGLIRDAENGGSLEYQEILISVMTELYPDLVDPLEDSMGSDERMLTNPAMTLSDLKNLIETAYDWALGEDYAAPAAQHYFWYRSEEKEEPRLGERWSEPGSGLETPIGVARDVSALHDALAARSAGERDVVSVAAFLIAEPHWRRIVTRVQTLAGHPYAEIRDNLLGIACHPVDLLRCKLSLFGASRYDPKSDRWTRVNFFQGAPLPDQLDDSSAMDWAFPVFDLESGGA
ncbi:MAG: hypothetical protein H8E30_07150 [Alphaproteobacteria bacterium]|nr:hypothetical protein [Alphaproteobacteria bacterium]